MPLTVRQVQTLKDKGRYLDGGGLHLQIGPSGAKSWLLRYMLRGRAREMGLGRVKVGAHDRGLTLAEAREAANDAHRLLRQGLDPIDYRRTSLASAVGAPAFRDLAKRYAASHEAGWRSIKTATQFLSGLRRHAYPIIGNLPVDAITVEDVRRVLEPIHASVPVQAERVRSHIAMVIDSAIAQGMRTAANPASARTMRHVLPPASKVRAPRHHSALPYSDIPALVRELKGLGTTAASAMLFTILTAARTGESINATWAEIHAAQKLWIIPAARMKGGREHRVPLSKQAVAVLESLPREKDNSHLFIGGRRGKGLSNMAMLKLLKELRPEATIHGMRSAFRDWCSERGKAPRELAEAALAHVVGSKTERAYARSALLDQRQRLMQRWADFCTI